MKNKVFNSFAKNIPFVPEYSIIKNKIEMEQYCKMERKVKNKFSQLRFAGVVILLVLCMVGIFSTIYTLSELKIKYVEQSNVLLYNHDKEFVDSFEFVFVGKVKEEIQTKQYDGTGMNLPYTFYSFEVVHTLKGNKDSSNSLLCFFGGYKNQKKLELLKNNDELIETERYYLFFANRNDDSMSRVGLNNYIISDNIQKVLLDEYDGSRKLIDQNQDILTIINRYTNIINETLGNDILEIEDYEEKKDIYDAYDYVSIIKVNHYISVDTSGEGIYSEIVSAYYSITVLMNFKKETDLFSKNLYCYGTDFWNNEDERSHYVNLLEGDSVYLLLANECSDNKDNTRMNVGDFVVMDNYQLVQFNDYQINQSYEKQNDNIKMVIDEYIK